MRRLVDRADQQRGCRQAVGWRDEGDVGAFLLIQHIGGVFADGGHLVVAAGEAIHQLHAAVEGVRQLLGEGGPIGVAVQFAQFVPLHELQAGGGDLATHGAAPAWIEQILPVLRGVGLGDAGFAVADAGEVHAGPEIGARRIAEVFRLVGVRLGRLVDFVAALLLEIDRRREVGELDHVHVVSPGAALGEDLAVQCASLRADVAALDLGKVLGEGIDDGRSPRLVLMAIENELPLLLHRSHVGVGLEIEHFGGLAPSPAPTRSDRTGWPHRSRRPRAECGGGSGLWCWTWCFSPLGGTAIGK